MINPLVSVVIPSFNHAKYIQIAINSVLNQDYDEIELIIIDDGSTDDTYEVLSKIEHNKNVTLIFNNINKGQGAVLNQALRICKGKYVCFLPSDDWFLPNKISLQVEKFKQCDDLTGVVYGRGKRFYPESNEMLEIELPMYRGWVLEKFIKEDNFVYPVTPMFKKECFDVFPYDESYKIEGEAIYFKLALRFKFDFVDEYVGVMLDHSDNTGKKLELMYQENVRYWTEFYSRPDLPAGFKKYKNKCLSNWHKYYVIETIYRLNYDNFENARAAFIFAVKLNKLMLLNVKLTGSYLVTLLPHNCAGKLVNSYKYLKGSNNENII